MLHLNAFLVREHVRLLRLTDVYDILDPATGTVVAVARETPPVWAQALRLVVGKRGLPTRVTVGETAEPGSRVFFTLDKPFAFLRSRIIARDGAGRPLGTMVSKLLSIGGGFHVYDDAARPVAEIRGDLVGWNFSVRDDAGNPLGQITKRWAGIGKEFFTSADTYVVETTGPAANDPRLKSLVLGAALAIDVVYKERDR